MKPNHSRLAWLVWAPLAFFLFMWSGCLQPVEGCLDPRAFNYNVAADEHCCCTWPTLRFSVNHIVGNEPHQPDSTYINTFGQSWRLLQPVLLISDVALHFEGKERTLLLDSMLIPDLGGMPHWWRNDQRIIDRDASTITIGQFINSGLLDSITFKIGLAAGLEDVAPDRFPIDHPLNTNEYGLYQEGDGFSVGIARFFANNSTDTTEWRIKQPLEVSIPANVFVVQGSDITYTMNIDYQAWFALQDLSGPFVMPDTNWPQQVRVSLK